MFKVLIPLLIWLSSVYAENQMNMHTHQEEVMMEDGISSSMNKLKRYSVHESPCPPYYPNVGPWAQAPIFTKPYGPPNYPKNEVSVQQMHGQVQFIHEPSHAAVVPKQSVTYIKPVYHAVQHEPKVIYQKPMVSYAPVYHKPMYNVMAKAYLKKYEAPLTQVVYQKPMIHYKHPEPMVYGQQHYQSKVIHVQPQIPHVKIVQPQVHAPMYYSLGHMMHSGKYGCD